MNLLYLTFIFPLVGFLLLATLRTRLSENTAAVIGVGSMGLSALTALYAASTLCKTFLKVAPMCKPYGRGCKWVISPRILPYI